MSDYNDALENIKKFNENIELKAIDFSYSDLSKEQIESLLNEINDINRVESLDLTGVELTQFPNKILEFNRLKRLIIANNYLIEIPDDIKKLNNLEKLYLSNNKIQNLPNGLTSLVQLKTLKVENNKLQRLPTNAGQLSSLKELHLSKNKFTELSKEICSLTNLNFLSMNDNQIVSLHDDIQNLSKLKILQMSRNRLTYCGQIANLQTLEKLSLESNQLENLSIDNLSNLKWLNCAKNNLQNLPDEVGALSNLEDLDCEQNSITSVPESIRNLNQTVRINLRLNPLSNETIHFIESINMDIEYGGNLTTENISFDDILKKMNISLSENNLNFINNNQALQTFIEKAWSSMLSQTDYGIKIMKNGLIHLLDQIENNSSMIMAEVENKITDCSTPVADLLTQQYIFKMKEDGEFDHTVCEKLALSDYVLRRAEKFKLNKSEAIEQREGLLNAVYLKDSHLEKANKIKIKHDNEAPSNTRYIDFSFNQVRQETASQFINMFCILDEQGEAKKDSEGYLKYDVDKVFVLKDSYEENVLGLTSEHAKKINTLVNSTYADLLQKIYSIEDDNKVKELLSYVFNGEENKQEQLIQLKLNLQISTKNTLEANEAILNKYVNHINDKLNNASEGDNNQTVSEEGTSPDMPMFNAHNSNNEHDSNNEHSSNDNV
ncbi:leucine-rich repeat domain-containing protein [Thiotrichales bacterium 19X7-9]|nr:leucine-rich repeat domain-containing protein [Thiotrichales bacterium 19X7-9]